MILEFTVVVEPGNSRAKLFQLKKEGSGDDILIDQVPYHWKGEEHIALTRSGVKVDKAIDGTSFGPHDDGPYRFYCLESEFNARGLDVPIIEKTDEFVGILDANAFQVGDGIQVQNTRPEGLLEHALERYSGQDRATFLEDNNTNSVPSRYIQREYRDIHEKKMANKVYDAVKGTEAFQELFPLGAESGLDADYNQEQLNYLARLDARLEKEIEKPLPHILRFSTLG